MDADHRSPAARVQACRTELAAQVQAYRDLVGAASKASGMSLTRIDAALAALEPAFFNNLLIALDARFANRPDGVDGRQGDALDEVRLLCAALMANGGVLAAQPGVAYEPSLAVLRVDIGERVALNADDFEAIAAAFLDTIEHRLAAG
jgi:hypothetical protein